MPAASRPGQALDAVDLRIVAATQGGLPLVEDPVGELARQVELDRQVLAQRLQAMLDSGAIRRIGAVPNHYRLGLRGNGMTVWDVPDDMAVALGEQVGALDFVSHSYLRPRYPGHWNYNLFAMVHGHDRGEVLDKTQQVEAILAPHCRAHDILFSSAVLKKTGLRLAA
ncbi:MAG: Lrp/AsnC family transcriptional regulator [Gammaproteobacteria bacterium]|nr:Lrp/AsnC family transcriptional regulator [Gammaproteobacteria bacterium]